jgi:hypothetical protein
MAPPVISVENLISRFMRTPKNERTRALADLTVEEREALYAHSAMTSGPIDDLALSRTAKRLGMSADEARAFMVANDEHMKQMSRTETDVNHYMQLRADQLPSTALLSIPEIREYAKELSEKIFRSWRALHTILDVYEELIRKRWMKKTRTQK